MEEKLGSILGNPQLMQQIMALAQSMNQEEGTGSSSSAPAQEAPQTPNLDTSFLARLTDLASKGTIDSQQRSLIKALSPYLQETRLRKLERAMQAAKIAQLASGLLGGGGAHIFTGR